MSEKQTGTNPLEQFVILSKSVKGAGAVGLIKQVLEAPGVYVFGELLEMPNIQELSSGDHSKYFSLLNLFAYGTYKDYKDETDINENADDPMIDAGEPKDDEGVSKTIKSENCCIYERNSEFPELTPAMLNKLRHLTMVSLATKNKCIPYRTLLEELDIPNLRSLEDLIIEVIYADIIHGKLDQKNQQLEVDYAIGRDIQPEAVPEILAVLQDWCTGCEAVLQGIETQITKANQNKENNMRQKQKIEQEIVNIKKTLKSTHADDENMVTESVSLASDKPAKKTSKTKGLRGSSGTKLWK